MFSFGESYPISFLQPVTEEVKKEFTDRDVHEGFDITQTKHRGQVGISRKLIYIPLNQPMITIIPCVAVCSAEAVP